MLTNHKIGQEVLQVTYQTSASEKLSTIMVARSGDYTHVQNPMIFENLKPSSKEIIPVSPFNFDTAFMNAWMTFWRKRPKYEAATRQFYRDWRNGKVQDNGKWKFGAFVARGVRATYNKLWESDGKDDEGEPIVFKPEWYLLFPETAKYYHPKFAAVSHWDGFSPGNQAHVSIDDKDQMKRLAKAKKIYDGPKNYIFMGSTMLTNPIRQHRMRKFEYDADDNFKDPKTITQNKPLTVYFQRNVIHKFPLIEYEPEDQFGSMYMNTGDVAYRYHQSVGFTGQYDGGFAWNYVMDMFINIHNEQANRNVPSEQIDEYISRNSKQIKVNIYSEDRK